MSNKTHDIVKAIALLWLPALGTLFFTFTDIWALAWGKQVVGSIMAVDTFLGVILGISTRTYNMSGKNVDGELLVDGSGNPLKLELETLPDKKTITVKVTPPEKAPAG
jgi:Putative phage holin Dp-1